jgi:hypothetical protein
MIATRYCNRCGYFGAEKWHLTHDGFECRHPSVESFTNGPLPPIDAPRSESWWRSIDRNGRTAICCFGVALLLLWVSFCGPTVLRADEPCSALVRAASEHLAMAATGPCSGVTCVAGYKPCVNTSGTCSCRPLSWQCSAVAPTPVPLPTATPVPQPTPGPTPIPPTPAPQPTPGSGGAIQKVSLHCDVPFTYGPGDIVLCNGQQVFIEDPLVSYAIHATFPN